MDDRQRYLDPLTLAKVRSLELQARLVVEGYLSGMHKSPYHGFSVEFAQHREYSLDRGFVGREVQLDRVEHVLAGEVADLVADRRREQHGLVRVGHLPQDPLDVGPEADVQHPVGLVQVSKYDYACMTAAALAYLILQQQDSVGLVTFDSQVRQFLRPSSQRSHLKEIVRLMNRGASAEKTRLATIFHEMAERMNRRAIVVLLSDLFDDPREILAGLKHLRYKRHEVVVFHIMDSAELDFPFQEATLFRGLEQLPELLTDPRSLREGYVEELARFLDELKRGCRTQNIDYVPMRTDGDVGTALAGYLARRLRK